MEDGEVAIGRTATAGVLGGVALLAASGCAGAAPADGTVTGEVVVSAAASLTDVAQELATAFEASHPGTDVVLNLAGSSTLARQVAGGAPVDVLALADTADLDPLVADGLLASDPVVFARNRLTVAVPAGNPAGVTELADLTDPALLVGLCAPQVPCGRLARDLLEAAGVEAAVDTEEPDVRALLTKLALGELDAGITYVTDVAAEPDVEGIPITGDVEASYPVAVPTDAPNPAGAAAFVELLLSAEGRAVLADHGFAAP